MPSVRDPMPSFELFQPTSVAAAHQVLARYGQDAWILAGGMDSFDWLKDRIKRPKVVVDLSGVEELRGVREGADGIEIGAMTTLTEVATNRSIRERYGLLAQAAVLVASPQIRNQGTLGGNVSQDARCWYYRAGWPCYRAAGNICYADTPVGRNREHAILHADRCVAVNPSDTAPALIALDAKFVMRTSKGDRVVDAEDYFIGPDIDITRLHILRPGDLLTSIRIPSTWAGSTFYFEKVRDRNVWDFPLLNVASAMTVSGNTIDRIRLSVNAAAARPLRLKAVEAAVRGKARTVETGEMAGALAVRGAVPLAGLRDGSREMKNPPPDPAAPPRGRCRMAMLTALLLSLAACAHAHTAESPAVEAGQADSPAISPWAEPEPDTSIEEDPAYTQVAADR